MNTLAMLGEAEAAMQEVRGYGLAGRRQSARLLAAGRRSISDSRGKTK